VLDASVLLPHVYQDYYILNSIGWMKDSSIRLIPDNDTKVYGKSCIVDITSNTI